MRGTSNVGGRGDGQGTLTSAWMASTSSACEGASPVSECLRLWPLRSEREDSPGFMTSLPLCGREACGTCSVTRERAQQLASPHKIIRLLRDCGRIKLQRRLKRSLGSLVSSISSYWRWDGDETFTNSQPLPAEGAASFYRTQVNT